MSGGLESLLRSSREFVRERLFQPRESFRDWLSLPRTRTGIRACVVCGFIKAAFAKELLVLVAVVGVLPILNAIS